MTTSNPAAQVADNDFLHLLRMLLLWVALGFATLFFGLGLLFYAAILRSTGGRARDLFSLVIPVVHLYVGFRALWRYTAKNHYWEDRTDLNPHPFFGPGRTFAVHQPPASPLPSPSPSKDARRDTATIAKTTSEIGHNSEAFECGDCGNEVAAGANFCPSCGTNFDKETFECAYCKAEVSHDAKFCASCGEEFQKLDPNDPETQLLRSELAAAEQQQQAKAQLEELRIQSDEAKESAREVSLQLGHAESQLRTLRSRDGDQLEGDKRITFLREQLEATEEVERLKEALKRAETRAKEIETALDPITSTMDSVEDSTKTDLQIERDRRYAAQRAKGPQIKHLAREEGAQPKRRQAHKARSKPPDAARTSTGIKKDDDRLRQLEEEIQALRRKQEN
jgi:hypothetical protein